MTSTRTGESHLQNELASTLLDQFEYAYFEIDLRGYLTFVKRLFCKALGYSQEELTGLHYRHITAHWQIRQVYQVFNQVYRSGELKKGIEYPMRKKDGSMSFTEGSINLLRDGSGVPVGFCGIMHDISQRKQEEERRSKAQQGAYCPAWNSDSIKSISSLEIPYWFTRVASQMPAIRTVSRLVKRA